jgi:DNA-binding FadR family transcriptional regulator
VAKLAEITAARIEADIIANGWQVGTIVGSEPELIRRYGVSRAIFREAVRLVEHHYLAEMRRGPGGGLVVREPDPAAVADAMTIFFEYKNVQYEQLYEAREVLELHAVEALTRSIDETGIMRMRAYLTEERADIASCVYDTTPQFHELIADMTGNPALSLFVKSLIALSRRQLVREQPDRVFYDVHRVHERISDAIVLGDSGLARHRMARHLRAMSDWWLPAEERQRVQPEQALLNS